MPLDPLTQETVEETIKLLKDAVAEGRKQVAPIQISARRMRSMILFMQQRMQIVIDNVQLHLYESDDPPQLQQAIDEAMPPPEPVLAGPDEQAATPEDLAEYRAWKASKANRVQ